MEMRKESRRCKAPRTSSIYGRGFKTQDRKAKSMVHTAFRVCTVMVVVVVIIRMSCQSIDLLHVDVF